MPVLEILDTTPTFWSLWSQAQYSSVEAQIELWLGKYMAGWPALLQKQLDDYASLHEDWRAMAGVRVFPFLSERLPAMQTARSNLLKVCDGVYKRCQQTIQFNNNLICVIYVGIGCGAGWATTYAGKPAILFGLENIAEEGWQNQESLTGLMAHELGHLIHSDLRQRANLTNEVTPWWQLYTEGFAQWCEHAILGKPSWHMQNDQGEEWQSWCQENLGWLATEFLYRVAQNQELRQFFGSWYDLRGYKQTGYFLGYHLIKILLERKSFQDVALLTEIGRHLQPLLTEMAE